MTQVEKDVEPPRGETMGNPKWSTNDGFSTSNLVDRRVIQVETWEMFW